MEDKVLETVVNNLDFIPVKDLLVKPLPPTMVTKTVTEQIPTGEKDENGYNLYDTKTETKEVESDWSIGIILAGTEAGLAAYSLKIGDKIVYNKKFAVSFDLFKDSVIVKPYDVVCKVKA